MVDRKYSLQHLINLITATSPTVYVHGVRVRGGREREGGREGVREREERKEREGGGEVPAH